MHKSQSFLFNLITSLHVSGVTTIHPQEHKATASTASGNHYTILLSAAIVEKLELIWVCCRWRVLVVSSSWRRQASYAYNNNQTCLLHYCCRGKAISIHILSVCL